MNRSQRAALRAQFEEVATLSDMFADAVTSLRAALLDAEPKLFDAAPLKRVMTGKYRAPVDVAGIPPSRHFTNQRRIATRTPDVNGDLRGAVAASMRRAIATEAADALRVKTDIALTTRELVGHCPTAQLRYKTLEKQIAGLGGILREMGDRYNIKNVSSNTNSRWMFVTKIEAKL